MRSFENTDKNIIEEWLQSDACEPGFQHMTNVDIINTSVKHKGEKEGGNESE
jgi:hypothetical protein